MRELEKIARRIRLKALTAMHAAESGHPGASLSAADIVTALYFDVMDPGSDRFVLSKGHAAPILYAALNELGWISHLELMSLRQPDSPCQGHPDRKALECIDAGTGALGQGLSMAIGFAEAAHLNNWSNRAYCLLGDGECQEGQVWEAAMYAGAREISNVCAIIDRNGFQNEKSVADTLPYPDLAPQFGAFGWHVIEVDGHDFGFLREAFKDAKDTIYGPTVIIADTIKGRGVSFMEENNDWHGKVIDGMSFAKIKEELSDNH